MSVTPLKGKTMKSANEMALIKRLQQIGGQRCSGNNGSAKFSERALDDGMHDGEVYLSRYLLDTFFPGCAVSLAVPDTKRPGWDR